MSARESIQDRAFPEAAWPVACLTSGVVVADLLGVVADGALALVRRQDDPTAAVLHARCAVDLHSRHVGHRVVLAIEQGAAQGAIVVGVLRPLPAELADPSAGEFALEADGERLVVTAREQLVLRCGKASVTLTRAGKVLIEGTYLSSRSSGTHRIKGGSVDIN